MNAMHMRLLEVRREIDAVTAVFRPLNEKLNALSKERRDLESKIFIEVNKIKKGDVELSEGGGKPFFGNVFSFIAWLKENSKKPWSEWNGRIYHTFDLINSRMPDMPGFVEDLKD